MDLNANNLVVAFDKDFPTYLLFTCQDYRMGVAISGYVFQLYRKLNVVLEYGEYYAL